MAAPVFPVRWGRHIDHVHIRREPLDIGRCAFEQERVAHLDRQVIELPDILVPPVHRQRIDTVSPPQPHCTQLAPHHPAARGDQHLDRRRLDGRNLIDPPQFAVALQAQEFGHLGPQDHTVTHLQLNALEVAPQRYVTPNDVDQPHTFALEKLDPGHLAADQVGSGRDDGLGKKLHLAAVRQEPCHAVPSGQQPWGNETQIDHAVDHQHDGQRRDLEDREGLKAPAARHAVDQQVGRCPDQSERAAEDRGIAERDQQLGRCQPHRLGQLRKDRDHHDDNRRIRHDGRGQNDEQHQERDGKGGVGLGLSVGQPRQAFQRARSYQSPHDQEHGGDGPWCGVRQDGQCVFVRQRPDQQHERNTGYGDNLGREGFAQEQHEHDDDDGQRQNRQPRLGKLE